MLNVSYERVRAGLIKEEDLSLPIEVSKATAGSHVWKCASGMVNTAAPVLPPQIWII